MYVVSTFGTKMVVICVVKFETKSTVTLYIKYYNYYLYFYNTISSIILIYYILFTTLPNVSVYVYCKCCFAWYRSSYHSCFRNFMLSF